MPPTIEKLKKINRTVVIIPDETIYKFWINLKIDVGKLEKVGSKIGMLLATDSVASSITRNIRRNYRLDGLEVMAWSAKIKIDNDMYRAFLKRFSGGNLSLAFAQVEAEKQTLSGILKKLDAGLSEVDISLVANAYWIRLRTQFEPIILTDDTDLLGSAQILASFFGISLGCISSFEALRLTELDEHLDDCCRYFDFNLEGKYGNLSTTWTKKDLEKSVSKVFKKGKIACHLNKVTLRLARHVSV